MKKVFQQWSAFGCPKPRLLAVNTRLHRWTVAIQFDNSLAEGRTDFVSYIPFMAKYFGTFV